jgi:hypothetical protein
MQSNSRRGVYTQRLGVKGVARNMQDSMTLSHERHLFIFLLLFSLSSNGVQHPERQDSGNGIQALVYYGSFIHW